MTNVSSDTVAQSNNRQCVASTPIGVKRRFLRKKANVRSRSTVQLQRARHLQEKSVRNNYAPKVHWVLKLKFRHKNESVEALIAKAAEQITQKQYSATTDKSLIRVVTVFSKKKRQFARWVPMPQ